MSAHLLGKHCHKQPDYKGLQSVFRPQPAQRGSVLEPGGAHKPVWDRAFAAVQKQAVPWPEPLCRAWAREGQNSVVPETLAAQERVQKAQPRAVVFAVAARASDGEARRAGTASECLNAPVFPRFLQLFSDFRAEDPFAAQSARHARIRHAGPHQAASVAKKGKRRHMVLTLCFHWFFLFGPRTGPE